MGAGLRFEAPACECVITSRNYHAWRYLEGREQGFAVRVPIKFEAVACFHSNVNRRHEVFPRFKNPARVSHSRVLILEKLLAYPTEMAFLRWAWLVRTAQVRLASARSWQETKQWLKAIAVLIHIDLAIQEIVGIIDFKAPSSAIPWRCIALSSSSPATHEEVFVSLEL